MMRISRLIYKTIIILMLVISMFYPCKSYALEPQVAGSDELGLPLLSDNYKPSVEEGTSINIISKLLGILTVVGVVAIAISIGIIGFSSILGSAGEKAVAQEKYMGIVIAALLITGGSILARIIISVAENIK